MSNEWDEIVDSVRRPIIIVPGVLTKKKKKKNLKDEWYRNKTSNNVFENKWFFRQKIYTNGITLYEEFWIHCTTTINVHIVFITKTQMYSLSSLFFFSYFFLPLTENVRLYQNKLNFFVVFFSLVPYSSNIS